jgi:hypothetical protein
MPAIIPLVVAGVGAAASAYAAHKSSSAVSSAADTQTTAANYAAKLQSDAAARALQFQQQQSAIDQQNFQKTQNANYGQFQTASNENYGQYAAGAQTDYDRWALHQNNMGYLGQLLGLPARQLPAAHIAAPPVYGANPFDTGGSASIGSSGTPSQSIMDALKANYKSLGYAPTGPGTGPTDIAYFANAAAQSAAAGERPLSYWLGPNGRVAQELAQAGVKPNLGGNG